MVEGETHSTKKKTQESGRCEVEEEWTDIERANKDKRQSCVPQLTTTNKNKQAQDLRY